MTNQLLNVENCVEVEPKKVAGQGFELRVVNYCHSLLQTELMLPSWYIFLRLSSNSNQILSKVSSCPFVVPDESSQKGSSVLRADLVCLRTCWTLVLTWSLKWFALVDREFSSSIGTGQQLPRHQPDTLDSTWDKIILPYWTCEGNNWLWCFCKFLADGSYKIVLGCVIKANFQLAQPPNFP